MSRARPMIDDVSTPGRPAAEAGRVEVSIVIPCLDESATIGACVRAAWEALGGHGYLGEVIVSDNGSSDGSADMAEAAGARVVHQPIRGYGAAVLRGLEAARGSCVVVVDGDSTYDMAVLARFVEPLRAGYDLVLGTRRNGLILPRAMDRLHRHLLEPIQTHLSRYLLRFHVSDLRCGMRGIRADALSRMRLGSVGMELASEMLVEAARVGLDVVEVPVLFRPRPVGGPRRTWRAGWRVASQLLLLSPTRLFLLPGLSLLAIGLGVELVLLPGPLRVGGFTFDFHFIFVAGALAILGLQLVLLGLYAKTYALLNDAGLVDPWIRRFHLHYTLERGVALGGLLFGAGLVVNVGILSHWLAAGAGVLFAVRPAMLALTLMILGAELIFASFFLSLLRGAEFGRT